MNVDRFSKYRMNLKNLSRLAKTLFLFRFRQLFDTFIYYSALSFEFDLNLTLLSKQV